MADNTVRINLEVASKGMDPAVGKSQTIKDNLTAGAAAMGKVGGAAMGGTTGSRTAAEKVSGQTYSAQRGVAGVTGASARNFAAESQGLGGLVRLYATVAANTYAAAAAFTALSNAMNTSNMIKGLDQLGAASGRNLGGLASQLAAVSNGAINMADSMKAVAQASSAGMSGASILQMGEVAKKASQALGISMPDAINRLTRGITKLEPELLDELGLFTKLDKSTQDYARSVGKTAATLSDFERRQAFANAVLKEGTDKFSNIKIDSNPYDKLLASTQNLAQSTLELINKVLGPLVKMLSESPTALAVAIGAVGLALIKQAIPAITEWRASMAKAAIEAAAVSKRISTAYEDFDIGKKMAKGLQEAKVAATDAATHIQNVQKSLSKGSARTDVFKAVSAADYDPATGQAAIDKLATTSANRLKALEKERLDIVKYAGQTELDLIDKKIKKEQVLFDNRKKAAAENAAAIAKLKISTEAGDAAEALGNTQTGEGKRKAAIAAQAETKAVKLGVLSNVGITAEEKGSSAAFARLKDEIKNGLGTYDEFGKRTSAVGKGLTGMAAATTLAAGSFRIASVAISETLAVLGPWIALITAVVVAFGVLDSWLSRAQEEQDKFTATLKTSNEAAKTVEATLEFIGKKKTDVFGTESIVALSNALNGVTESLTAQIDAFEKLQKAQSGWEKGWDNFWSRLGRGNIDKLTDSISKDIPAALSAMMLDPKLEQTRKKFAQILNISPESVSETTVKNTLKALSSDKEREVVIRQLNGALVDANRENQNGIAALQGFEAALTNVGKEVDNLNNKLAFTDTQGKLGLGLIDEANNLAKALEDPIKGMEALYKLATSAKNLSLLSPDASADLIKLIPQLTKTKDEFDKLGKQLLNTKSKLTELGVPSEIIEQTAKRGTGRVDSTQFFKKGTKEYEQAALLDSLKPLQDAFVRLKENIITNQKAANDAVGAITAAGMEQLKASLKLSKEMSAISISRSQLSITSAIGQPVAREETKLRLDELAIQQRLINASYNSAIKVEENSVILEKISAQNALMLAKQQEKEAPKGSADAIKAQLAVAAAQKTLDKLDLVSKKGSEAELRGKKSDTLTDADKDALQVFDKRKIIAMGKEAEQDKLKAQTADTVIQGMLKGIAEDQQLRDKKLNLGNQENAVSISDIANREKYVGIYTESIASEKKRLELVNLEIGYKLEQSANQAEQARIDKELNKAKKADAQATLNRLKSVQESNYTASKSGVQIAFDVNKFAESQKALAEADAVSLKLQQDKNALLILDENIDEQRLSTAQALNQIDEVTFLRLKESTELKRQNRANDLAVLQAQQALDVLERERVNNLERDKVIRAQNVQTYGGELGLYAPAAEDTSARDTNLQGRTQAAQSALSLAEKTAAIQPTITKAITEQNIALAQQRDYFVSLRESVESLAAAFGDTGRAIGESILKMEELTKTSADRAKQQEAADKAANDASKPAAERLELQKTADNLRKKNAKSELSDIGALAGSTKKMFSEKTTAYKVLSAAEKASHVLSLAMQAKDLAVTLMSIPGKIAAGVAGLFAQGGWAGFAGAAAFIALMASLGHSKGSAPTAPSAEQKQEVQGTGQTYVNGTLTDRAGGVPGDVTAKADSLNKSLEILEKYQFKEVEYSNKMLEALKAIKANTSNLGSLLVTSMGSTTSMKRRSASVQEGELRGNASLGAAGTVGGMAGGGAAGMAVGLAAEWALMGSAISSTLGTAIMAAMGPLGLVAGVLLGATLNKVIGKIFGGKTTVAITDFGLSIKGSVDQLSDATNNLVQEYTDYTKTVKGGWFRSDKTTQGREMGASANAQIQEIFADSIKSSKTALVEAGRVLGEDPDIVSAILGGFQVATEISLKGLKPEEAAKALEAEFSMQMNLMANTADLGWIKFKKFANAGEEAGEAVIRLARDIQIFDITVASLGKTSTLAIKGLDKLEIVEPMIAAAGGLENFTKQAQQFASDFLTESERLAPVQKALTTQLESLGLSGDLSVDMYKKLVLGTDLNTAAGRALYQDLMDIEPAMKLVGEATKKTKALEIDLLEAQGYKIEALAARREIEYAAMSDTDAALKRRIDLLNDEKTAYDKLRSVLVETVEGIKGSVTNLRDAQTSLLSGANSFMSPEQRLATQKTQYAAAIEATKGPLDTPEQRKAVQTAAQTATKLISDIKASGDVLYASGQENIDLRAYLAETAGGAADALEASQVGFEEQIKAIDTGTNVLKSIDSNLVSMNDLLADYTSANKLTTDSIKAGGEVPAISTPNAVADAQVAAMLSQVAEQRETNRLLKAQLDMANEQLRSNAVAMQAQTDQLNAAAADLQAQSGYNARTTPDEQGGSNSGP